MFICRTFALVSVSAASILFGLAPFGRAAAQDVRHECSEKYEAAKAAGTLNGDTWPQFYSKCTAEARGAAAAAELAAAPPPPDTVHICSEKYEAAKAAGTLNDDTWPQFYSKCTAEARGAAAAAESAAAPPPPDTPHICSEKYEAAKAAGTLNDDTWPQFYSKCVADIKANPPAAAAAPTPATPAPVVAAPSVETPAPPVAAAPAEEAPAAPVAEAPAPPPPVAAPAAPVVAPAPANPPKKTPAAKPVAPALAAAPSTAVFPSAISPTYANEKPGKARQKTCLDQYNANKATNANGGLKWIQKGGGYLSECNKHLKG